MLYTDGLLEMAEGEQEDQLRFMADHLNGGHEWREEAMRDVFFVDDSNQERDDDKCLVWISLKERKGKDKE
ncbi:hypothetical protein D3C87_1704960 [compost metagenome]